MRKYFNQAFGLAKSQTAKDTYTLFVGNVAGAFLGFVFTLIVARALTVSDFGIFSAAANLVVIFYSIYDLGLSGGLINFVAEAYAKKRLDEERAYIKAAFILRFLAYLFLSLLVFIFARQISIRFLATDDIRVAYWVSAISFGFMFEGIFSPILQAEKRFLPSVLVTSSIGVVRPLVAGILFLIGGLTLGSALFSFALGTAASIFVGFAYVGIGFLFAKATRGVYTRLIKFSGWLGVNRIISGISGRLDITMLAAMVGATATGLYSIPSRLTSFVVVLASSFSAVLAPRLASFGKKDEERKYLVKATLATGGIIIGVIIWILIARPFILILFGEKYIEAVPIFQALTASMIPFLIAAVPSVAIIYSMKKPVFIGVFSFFQVAAIFFLNLVLIPRYGVFGPTITFAAVNSILAIYTWTIVIKHYWLSK